MTTPGPTLGDLLADATRVVAFTGAGISTESGIPDFRSPGGVWTRVRPRRLHLRPVRRVRARSAHGPGGCGASSWPRAITPNAGHRALARLEQAGRSPGVVTQNIDGLHQDAGSVRVVEVHGTAREVMCIGHSPRGGVPEGCGFTARSAGRSTSSTPATRTRSARCAAAW